MNTLAVASVAAGSAAVGAVVAWREQKRRISPTLQAMDSYWENLYHKQINEHARANKSLIDGIERSVKNGVHYYFRNDSADPVVIRQITQSVISCIHFDMIRNSSPKADDANRN